MRFSISARLVWLIALLFLSGLMGIFGAIEINKGATLHKLNFLHIKFNQVYFEDVSRFRRGSVDVGVLKQNLIAIREQPLACLEVIGRFEQGLMTILGTDRAIDLCVNDVALADRTLDQIDRFEAGTLDRAKLVSNLSQARVGFAANSAEFEPLVARTVEFFSLFFLVSLAAVTVIASALGIFLTRSIGEDYRKLAIAERALRSSETMLAEMGRMAKVGHWELEPRSNRVVWSDEVYRIHGAAPGREMYLDEALRFYVPEDRSMLEGAIGRAIDEGEPFDLEARLIQAKGGPPWVQVMAHAERVDGTTVRVSGTIQDISARKLAEEEGRDSETRFRAVFDTVETATIVIDSQGIIQLFNPHAEKIFGHRADEVRGRNVSILMPEAHGIRHDGYLERYAWTGEAKIIGVVQRMEGQRRDGEIFPLQFIVGEMHMKDATWFVASVTDLSEFKAIEEQLRQAQKLEAVGQLTGGIAHDFNNLLSVIQGNLYLVVGDLREGRTNDLDALRELLEAALSATQRSADLTQRLLAFSRRQTLDPRTISLNDVVRDLEDLLQRSLGENIDLKTRLEPEDCVVTVDASQLESALLNLALNARDAMPGGGKLTIETAEADLDEAYASEHPGATAGSYVVLSVSDNGTGMDQKTLDSAFEPFYTTKPVGQGSGLGLSMVHGFINQSGGHVVIHSELGEGTTVELYLPRASGREALPSAPRPQSSPKGDETILVVEDDEAVRQLTVRILLRLGYQALEAEDGQTALNLLRDNASIDLVLSDVVLRGDLHGPELAEAIRSQRPEIKILFMSGYAESAIVGDGRVEAGAHFLKKPFLPEDLATKIREALTDRG